MKKNWFFAALVLVGMGLMGGTSLSNMARANDDEEKTTETEDSAENEKEDDEAKEESEKEGDDDEKKEGMKEGEDEADEEMEEQEDAEMAAFDRQDAELEEEAMSIVERYQTSSKEDKPTVREKLLKSVSKHFEVRQARRELQIKRMEEELQKLRDDISKRNEGREKIITKRVQDLVGEESELEF